MNCIRLLDTLSITFLDYFTEKIQQRCVMAKNDLRYISISDMIPPQNDLKDQWLALY